MRVRQFTIKNFRSLKYVTLETVKRVASQMGYHAKEMGGSMKPYVIATARTAAGIGLRAIPGGTFILGAYSLIEGGLPSAYALETCETKKNEILTRYVGLKGQFGNLTRLNDNSLRDKLKILEAEVDKYGQMWKDLNDPNSELYKELCANAVSSPTVTTIMQTATSPPTTVTRTVTVSEPPIVITTTRTIQSPIPDYGFVPLDAIIAPLLSTTVGIALFKKGYRRDALVIGASGWLYPIGRHISPLAGDAVAIAGGIYGIYRLARYFRNRFSFSRLHETDMVRKWQAKASLRQERQPSINIDVHGDYVVGGKRLENYPGGIKIDKRKRENDEA